MAAECRTLLQGGDTTRIGRASGSASSDLANLSKFLASSSSEVDGRTIVHTTKRERRLVWVILVGIVVLAGAGLAYYGARAPTAVSKLPSAPAMPAAPASAQPGQPVAP